MRRFRFPLQRLLEIRKHKEDIIKNQMAQAQRRRIEHQQKKQAIVDRYADSIERMKEEEKAKMLSITKFQNYQNYLRYLRKEMEKQDTLIKVIDDEIAMISKKLVEARKDRRVIERLKERALQRYIYELRKEEQDFFDEVGTNRFASEISKQEEIEPEKKEKVEIPLTLPEPEDLTKKLYEEIMSGGKE